MYAFFFLSPQISLRILLAVTVSTRGGKHSRCAMHAYLTLSSVEAHFTTFPHSKNQAFYCLDFDMYFRLELPKTHPEFAEQIATEADVLAAAWEVFRNDYGAAPFSWS